MTTRKLCICSMLTAVSLMLGYIESLFPVYLGVPGAKLGIANIMILLVLYLYGPKEAILINVIRIMITGLLFTNLYSILFSLAGAVFSFTIMALLYKKKYFSMIGISILGGVFHHIGQILVAACVLESISIIYYLPLLVIIGTVTGAILGFIVQLVYPRMKRISQEEGK